MLVTLIVFLLVLSVLVLIHETGHFLVAKFLKIKVEEFGFGLPPRIIGIKKGETVYSLNLLPIGGFVRLYGEEGPEEKRESARYKEKAFYNRPVWQRFLVVIAGVIMNFILAVAIISFIFTQGVMVPANRVHIEKIIADSPAEKSGLQTGDVIKAILIAQNQKEMVQQEVKIRSANDLIETTQKHLNETITLLVERNKQDLKVDIIPRKEYPKDQGPMGIVVSAFEEKKFPLWQAPIYGLVEATNISWHLAKGISLTLFKLVTFQRVAEEVAGPIGIAALTGQAIKIGGLSVIEFIGILSLNLAIFNILPFPALDGGRLLFIAIEGVSGKRIKISWERYIHQLGMIILLLLVVLVTINDLLKIFTK